MSPALLADIHEVALPFGLGVATPRALAAARSASLPRYLGAPRRLNAFCLRRGSHVNSLESAGVAVAELVLEMFTDGDDHSAGQVLDAAWQATCPLAGRGGASLPRTSQALPAWSRLGLEVTRPPVPWLVAAAVAQVMVPCFTCCLRPPGGQNLQVADVVKPPYPTSAFVALNRHPKEMGQSSRTMATNKDLLIDHPRGLVTGDALLLASKLAAAQRVCPFTMDEFAARFRATHLHLGMEKTSVLYQMRHGGPSEAGRDRLTTPRGVRHRGRWTADASMKRYEAASRSQRKEGHLPRAVMTAVLAAVNARPSALTASLSRRLASKGGAGSASRSSPAAGASRSSSRKEAFSSIPSTSLTRATRTFSGLTPGGPSVSSPPRPPVVSSGWGPLALPGPGPGGGGLVPPPSGILGQDCSVSRASV